MKQKLQAYETARIWVQPKNIKCMTSAPLNSTTDVKLIYVVHCSQQYPSYAIVSSNTEIEKL